MLAVEKPPEDRVTTSAETVGEDQYTTGCLRCEKRTTILVCGIGKDAGDAIENQCIDKPCHAVFSKTLKESLNNTKGDSTSKSKKSKLATPKKVVAKPKASSKAVNEQARSFARKVGAEYYADNDVFNLSIALASVCKQSGYNPSFDSKTSSSQFNECVIRNMKQSVDVLNAEIRKASQHLMAETAADSHNASPIDLMIKALGESDEATAVLNKAWTPSDE